MILYSHVVIGPDVSILRIVVSTDPAYVESISGDPIGTSVMVRDIELDNIEALKAAWNPGTFQDRQAIVDALPKIQSISIAGIIQ